MIQDRRTTVLLYAILVFWTTTCVGQTVLKYYGVDDIEASQFSFLRDSLKGNFALVEISTDTATWRRTLQEAEKNNLKLIIWPQGHGQRYTPWAFDFLKWLQDPTQGWDLTEGLNDLKFAEQYITSGGQSLLAIVLSHEPFYAQGEQIFNSSQLKSLYAAFKKVAPHVKTYIYMNDFAYYDRKDPARQMSDGMMDICGTYKHSFGTKNTQAETLQEIDDDYDLIQRKGLHIQLFFALQTFGYATPDYRMPLASEMQALATKILEKKKLDGAFWYPWNRVSTSYVNWLSKDRYDSSGGDRWSVVTRLSSHLSVTGVKERELQPTQFSLSQNFPNPFNPTTAISFQLSAVSFVRLVVFDLLGREAAVLVDENRSAGVHTVRWEASSLPSGVYFYQVRAGGFIETKKMVIAK
ncbi:T9SS C-terminal target domain-containing protein [bacterium]|nr:MAG: T9SS C-terminal target domain-containing protein [bacterium]